MAAVAVLNVFFIVVTSLVIFEESAGLKCRVDNDDVTQEGFQDVVRACMSENFRDEDNNNKNNNNWSQGHRNNNHNNNNNNNNNNNWQQHRPHQEWSQGIPRFPMKDGGRRQHEQEQEQEESREEGEGYGRGGSYSHRGYRPNPRARTRRATPPRGVFGGRSNRTHPQPPRRQGSSPLEDVDPCIIHCIFRHMELLDNSNQPDKSSAINVMTGKLRDPELKNFIRDAISECFETLESENQESKCSFSKRFALCLEQKGQQNCEDWDDEIKRPGQKHSKGTNTNQNKHRG